jgi:CRP/FNR family transcriptional regulator, cyclic AMP receptor protein
MSKLTLIDKAFFLKRTALFGTLDLELLLAIADKLKIVTFESGEKIFGYNEEAVRIYFIVKGTVEILDRQNILLNTLDNEEFFGDESIFNEKPRGYQAISKTYTQLLALSRTNLLTIISECPSVAVGLLQAYSSMTDFRPRKEKPA